MYCPNRKKNKKNKYLTNLLAGPLTEARSAALCKLRSKDKIKVGCQSVDCPRSLNDTGFKAGKTFNFLKFDLR